MVVHVERSLARYLQRLKRHAGPRQSAEQCNGAGRARTDPDDRAGRGAQAFELHTGRGGNWCAVPGAAATFSLTRRLAHPLGEADSPVQRRSPHRAAKKPRLLESWLFYLAKLERQLAYCAN